MNLTNRVVKKDIKFAYPTGIANRVCFFPTLSDRDPFSLEDLFGQILVSGFMTSRDRQRIKSLLLDESVSEEHLTIINRLLYGVRRGFIKLAFE